MKSMSLFLFSFERNLAPKAVKANMSFRFYVFVRGRLAASASVLQNIKYMS